LEWSGPLTASTLGWGLGFDFYDCTLPITAFQIQQDHVDNKPAMRGWAREITDPKALGSDYVIPSISPKIIVTQASESM